MKSGNLNFLEPSGPLQACNGTALPFTYLSCDMIWRLRIICRVSIQNFIGTTAKWDPELQFYTNFWRVRRKKIATKNTCIRIVSVCPPDRTELLERTEHIFHDTCQYRLPLKFPDTLKLCLKWYDMIYIYLLKRLKVVKIGYMIWYNIFVNCNWVVTRWQKYSTHLHTNNT